MWIALAVVAEVPTLVSVVSLEFGIANFLKVLVLLNISRKWDRGTSIFLFHPN